MSHFGEIASMPVRTYEEERAYLEQLSPTSWRINRGFVANMNVPGTFYVNPPLQDLVFSELQQFCRADARHGFLPALKQIANVAALPGIVRHSIGLPDLHSGYGFAIGNVAAFDMDDPKAVVSPGGVGFDINCGVRLIRTNLCESDVAPVKDALAQSLFDHIPVGVGSQARPAPQRTPQRRGPIVTSPRLAGRHPNELVEPARGARARDGLVGARGVRLG